jgi:hypothetical protein
MRMRIMGYGVIIPPQDFKQPPRLCCQVKEVIKSEFGALTYGIASLPNFMKLRADILLLNVYKRMSEDWPKAGVSRSISAPPGSLGPS